MNKKKVKEAVIMIAESIEKDALQKSYCEEVWHKLKDIFIVPPSMFTEHLGGMESKGNIRGISTFELAAHNQKYRLHREFMKIIIESFEDKFKDK